jgi:hypothetical protein
LNCHPGYQGGSAQDPLSHGQTPSQLFRAQRSQTQGVISRSQSAMVAAGKLKYVSNCVAFFDKLHFCRKSYGLIIIFSSFQVPSPQAVSTRSYLKILSKIERIIGSLNHSYTRTDYFLKKREENYQNFGQNL